MAEPDTFAKTAVAIARRPVSHLLHLAAGPDPTPLRAAARAATGLDLPQRPGQSARAPGLTGFWLGPGSWLVEATDGTAALRLAAACAAVGTAVEVTGGRVVLALHGPGARLLLAAGCPLDLHPNHWPEGGAAPTLLAGVPVLLHATAPGVEVYGPRSYAQHLESWLRHAAATLVP